MRKIGWFSEIAKVGLLKIIFLLSKNIYVSSQKYLQNINNNTINTTTNNTRFGIDRKQLTLKKHCLTCVYHDNFLLSLDVFFQDWRNGSALGKTGFSSTRMKIQYPAPTNQLTTFRKYNSDVNEIRENTKLGQGIKPQMFSW